jgi:hypothetical protein
VRRHTKASPARSKPRHTGGASPPAGRLRPFLLLAIAAAFLLVPVAQAMAVEGTGTATVIAEGTGSGEVNSGLNPGEGQGTPPLACKYSGEITTGVCTNTLDFLEEEGFEYEYAEFEANADPGSKITRVEIAEGELLGCTKPSEGKCSAYVEAGTGNILFVAEFECEFVSCTRLKVEKVGEGTVTSSPGGIECGPTCEADFEKEAVVTLTASPVAGYMFTSWKGCDKTETIESVTYGVNGRKCTVKMSKAKTVSAKFTKTYNVSFSKVGSGLGKVQSSPGGLLCLNNCSATTAEFKEGTTVALSAVAAKHFHLVEWSGDCSGSGACSVTATANHSVGAKFAEDAQFALTLNKSGGGNGTVKSSVAGISCGATCSTMTASYYTGTEVELTATPGKGSTLKEWTGACSGSGACKVTMSAAKTVGAKFE